MSQGEGQIRQVLIRDQAIDGVIRFLKELLLGSPQFTWDDDPTVTQILIHGFKGFNLEAVDKKPRVAVQLRETSWKNLFVGNNEKLSLVSTEEIITDYAQADLTLHCASRNPDEAEILGGYLFEAVKIFMTELRAAAGFADIQSIAAGSVQEIITRSLPHVQVVPVNLRVQIRKSYRKILNREQFLSSGP